MCKLYIEYNYYLLQITEIHNNLQYNKLQNIVD